MKKKHYNLYKKIFLICLIIFSMISAMLAGCSNTTTDEGSIIRATVGPEPTSIDPQTGSNIDSRVYVRHLFEGLTRLDVNGNIVPGVADHWDISDDGLEYTFYLRDAKWSDGKSITAYDFEYAWKRALTPDTGCAMAFKLFGIVNAEKYNLGECDFNEVGIKAIDEKTFQIHLEKIMPYFLSYTNYETFMPVRSDIVDDKGIWTQSEDTYICNGAFYLSKWDHGSKIVLKKRSDYWDAKSIKTDTIEFLLIDDYNAGLNAYKSGQLDINDAAYPPAEVPTLIKNGDIKVWPMFGTYYYVFNTKKAPFDDAKVRRALSLAIDRDYIVNTVTNAGEVAATSYVPVGIAGSSSDKVFKTEFPIDLLSETARVDEAKKLIEEAGYPNGEGFPEIEILFNTSEEHKKIAEAIQQDWLNNLGVKATLRNIEWNSLFQTIMDGNFGIARSGNYADFNDPFSLLQNYVSGGSMNLAGWSNEEFDQCIQKAQNTLDPYERMSVLHDAETIMLEDAVICPIYWYVAKMLMNDNLKDVYISPFGGYNLHYAYIENN